MLQLGLIGYGAIGKHVAAALDDGRIESVRLVAALVRQPRAAPGRIPLLHDAGAFFRLRFDTVAEGAGHDAVRAYAVHTLEAGADLMVTSVGAFTDQDLFDRVIAAAKANGRRLILPSA